MSGIPTPEISGGQSSPQAPKVEKSPSVREKIQGRIDSYRRKRAREGHGLVRPTKIPGTEDDRGLVERFERAEILRTYLRFREEIRQREQKGQDSSEVKGRLADFRSKARVYENKMDILNEQFYKKIEEPAESIEPIEPTEPTPENPVGVRKIHIEDPELGILDNYVVTLDLNPPIEGQVDTRIPYLLIPTYAATPHHVVNMAASILYEGGKVIALTDPANRATTDTPEKIDDWLSRVKAEGSLRLHAKLVKKIAEKLEIQKANVVGISMGAEVALQAALDPEFASIMNDLVVVEPTGIAGNQKHPVKLLWDFAARQGWRTAHDKEMGIKTFGPSERPEFQKTELRDGKVARVLAPILAKGLITPEMIARINPQGQFQIWVGTKSSITGERTLKALLEAERQRLIQNPNGARMHIMHFEGDHSTPGTRLGVGSIITKPQDPNSTVIHVSSEDMDRGVAQSILSGRYT